VAQIESNKKKAEAPTGIIHYKKFDPNTASFDLLKSNGIPVHLAQRIISYREKGGQFRKKEDLIKIYGMNDELYATLSPHISIPPTKTYVKTKPSNHEFKKKHIITAFDINTADTSAFKQIRGVGTTLSNRIVKFRDQLGGFISTNQLNQVYGLEPEVIDSILSYGSISSDFTPMQVNINTDTIRHLSQHPFINYRLAKAVVNYRRQHGKFKELDQLKKIHLLDDSTYNKIQPYLIIGK
jgi:DNA uptake protein ComE-like DNA-binding protein